MMTDSVDKKYVGVMAYYPKKMATKSKDLHKGQLIIMLYMNITDALTL